MNLAHIEEQSFIYGPGCRFVIWTQGCNIKCKGCWNHTMWDFTPKNIFSVSEIIRKILSHSNAIEGITVLGGEPIDQYEETKELLKLCKKSNLTTMLYTGYTLEEINEKKMEVILKYCDILISGRFDLTKRTLEHQWIGSTNQKISFLTDTYKKYEIKNANYIEVDIEENGKVTMLGFPPVSLYGDVKNEFSSHLFGMNNDVIDS